ncbi:MAG: GNAT family N-acetyltransferase [Gemmatimonadaceae bacterium]
MDGQVLIRPYQRADAVEMVAAARESSVEVSRWMVWCRPDYSLADASTWIEATIAGRAAGTMYEFAITDGAGMFIGGCGINHINTVDQFANLGYWVRTSCTGRGVAPAAVRALIAWAFANTQLNRIEIVAATGNTRSQRVAANVGGEREAVLRQRLVVQGVPVDAVMFSVTRPA